MRTPPPFPTKWRTKRGKLTRAALRYVNARLADHHRFIQEQILKRR
jgi:hypothetical protein